MKASACNVRAAVPEDARAIGQLVRAESHHFLVDPASDEAQRFYASLEPAVIEKQMAEPNRSYAVAEVDGAVVGMMMVRSKNYISQFFVASAHQKRGIGSELWRFQQRRALEEGATGEFMVDSSVVAKDVYASLGFRVVGVAVIHNGFEYIPMHRAAASDA